MSTAMDAPDAREPAADRSVPDILVSPRTPSLMARLRAGTSDHHRRAETRPLQKAMAGGRLERPVYARYLAELRHLHLAIADALETASAQHARLASLGLDGRSHVHRIEQDLRTLARGESSDPVAPAREFAQVLREHVRTDPVAALGAHYVLEGSMNGNAFIARALAVAWGCPASSGRAEAGLGYLDPYGAGQRERWAQFRTQVDATEFTDRECDAIIAAARQTFNAVGDVSDAVWAAATPHGAT